MIRNPDINPPKNPHSSTEAVTHTSSHSRAEQKIDQEIHRLEEDFSQRSQQTRPMSHSVATAYRMTIAMYQNAKSTCKSKH